ncbi:TPA: PhnE/PtxC family ABC transporter permease [Enterococcus faecalis]
MKIKDTIHFLWYKKLFILFIIFICIESSIAVTGADFTEILTNFSQIGRFLQQFFPPDFSFLPKIITPLIKTLEISFLGTILGFLLAVPFSFLASNVVTKNRIGLLILRFFLSLIRTIPTLLLAALMVAIFGIGEATGATQLQIAVWSIFPQVASQFFGYAFYAFEVNVRASTVLGYVGAGGIGIILNTSLSLAKYDRVGIIILVILVMEIVVDWLSAYVRRTLL